MRSWDRKSVIVGAVIAIGVVFLGSAGVAYFSKQSIADEIQGHESKLEMLRLQLELTKQADAERQAEQPSARWQLCDGPEVVQTMQTVQSLADDSIVTVDGLQAKRSAETGRQSFTLAGHGDPAAVCGFLAGVEQDDRLMIVETGRFLPAGGGQVAFELGLATYYEAGK